MKYLTLFLVWIAYAHAGWLVPERDIDQKPATIKVLLQKHTDGCLIESRGAFEVINPDNNAVVSTGWMGKRYYAYPHVQGIKWGEDFPDIFQLRIVPKSADATLLVDGVQVKGVLELYHVDDKLHVINEVDVENYLKSTLTTKFLSGDIHPEVMDSLAIAARTNTYYTVMRDADAFWHVDAEEVGYNGYGLTLQNLNVDRAVDATKHLVMSYEGRPFPASWTEHCAGITASFSRIFRKNIPCPNGIESRVAANERENTKWTFSMSREKLAHLAKTNRITGIDLFLDDDSHKVYGIQVQDGKHHSHIDFFALQEALGKDAIRSNDFTVKLVGNQIEFEGYGEGAGVGLCLYSATQMAEGKELAPEILAKFFPFTHLQQQRSLPTSRYEEHHAID